MSYNNIINACLHTHAGGSLFDAPAEQGDYCEAAIAAGYKKLAVTDHGSFTAIQHCIDYINKHKLDLSIIYGVEAYVEIPGIEISEKVSHVIFMAKDEDGKHIIDKLNSNAAAAHYGTPVITWEQLANTAFNNHVIITSACTSGAPGTWLLINDSYKKEIAKLEASLNEENLVTPESPEYLKYKTELEEANKQLENLIAMQKSKKLENELKESNKRARDFKAKGLLTELEEEKDKANCISTNISKLKESISNLRKNVSNIKAAMKPLLESIAKFQHIKAQIEEIKSSLLPDNGYANAKKIMQMYKDLVGEENYFAEVQYHGWETEARVYPQIAKIAKELNIPLVAANDAHIPTNSDRYLNMRKLARFLRFNKVDFTDNEAVNNELYIKTPDELAAALSMILSPEEVDEAMLNINKISDVCDWAEKVVKHYPKYTSTNYSDLSSADLLKKAVEDGIKWRYPNGNGWDEDHSTRIKYELDVIISMGFPDYILIVKDFLEYARICGKIPVIKLPEVPLTVEGAKNYADIHNYHVGIGVGPGRGSGAGSLVTYVLGITDIDPFKYNLIFERFLNPERVSMPDIDSDIASIKGVYGVREKTIDYLKHKYGKNAVVNIITENREGAKSGIIDAARYRSLLLSNNENKTMFSSLAKKISGLIPSEPNTNFNTMIGDMTLYESLLKDFANNEDAIAIIKMAKDSEGMLRSYGMHAAGVIIYDDEDITDYIPIKQNKTEMDMVQCEALGLLKMDLLGLKTLVVNTEAIRMIERDTGRRIDLSVDANPFGDDSAPVYDNIYKNGNTKNVFQFESAGMRSYLKQLLAD